MDFISIVPTFVRINPIFRQYIKETTNRSILEHGELKFGTVSGVLDAAEYIADDIIGGPTRAMIDEIRNLEALLFDLLPEGFIDREWLDKRLGRALANEWCDEATNPIVEALILMPEICNDG